MAVVGLGAWRGALTRCLFGGALVLSVAFSLQLGGLAPLEPSHAQSNAPGVLGAKRCKLCHRQVYESWSKTPHATGVAIEIDDSTDGRAACHACHRTSERESSVQCEACHGPGEFYAQAEIMLDPEKAKAAGLRTVDVSACKRCHRPEIEGHDSLGVLPSSDQWSAWVHTMDTR